MSLTANVVKLQGSEMEHTEWALKEDAEHVQKYTSNQQILTERQTHVFIVNQKTKDIVLVSLEPEIKYTMTFLLQMSR